MKFLFCPISSTQLSGHQYIRTGVGGKHLDSLLGLVSPRVMIFMSIFGVIESAAHTRET